MKIDIFFFFLYLLFFIKFWCPNFCIWPYQIVLLDYIRWMMISLNKRCHLRRYLNHSESIINFSFQILLSLLVCLDCCNPDTCEAFSTTSDVSCINLAFISLAVDITANWLIAEQIDLFLLGITSRIVLELRPLSLGL